jgi:hypothetical protein
MGIFGKSGAVRVELERAVYYPGESVRGSVFLSIDKDIKAASALQIGSGDAYAERLTG